MKNPKIFQYVVMGVFIFFIIVGAIMFSTYRSNKSANENITINLWGSLSADKFNTFVNDYFTKSDIKYSINYTYKDRSSFDQELVEAIANGNGPDAIILPQDLIVRYYKRLFIIPFSVYPELDFKSTFAEPGEIFLTGDGALALPWMINPIVMYWNRDIFTASNLTQVPKTWTELLALSSKISKKDQAGNISRSLVAMGEYRNIKNAKSIISALLLQTQNPIVALNNGEFSSTLNSGGSDKKSSEKALEFYTNFSNPNRPEYSWNRSLANSQDAFANGDLAIYFGLASELSDIKLKNPNLNFDVATIPQLNQNNARPVTYADVYGLAIMKSSKNPAGAYSVISTLIRPEAVASWSNIFRIPSALRSVLGILEPNAIKSVLNKSAIISRTWYDPKYSDTEAILQELIESYTTGRETLSSSLNLASSRLDNLLKK